MVMSLIRKSQEISQKIANKDYQNAFDSLKKLLDEVERSNSKDQYDYSSINMNLGCLHYHLMSESKDQDVSNLSLKRELEETVQIKQSNKLNQELFDNNETGDLKEHTCKFQIALFNLAVLYFRNQDYFKCEKLLKLLYNFKDVLDGFIYFKVCSLYLELMLTLRNIVGLRGTSIDHNAFNVFTSEVLNRMTSTAATATVSATWTSPSTNTSNQNHGSQNQKNATVTTVSKESTVPALIGIKTHQYRSRLMLSGSELRMARKEIKIVFEQYQSNLRPLFEGSSGEDGIDGEGADSGAVSDEIDSDTNRKKAVESIFAYNISSLPAFSVTTERKGSISIKAHLEFIRGNYKKSLRSLSFLCSSVTSKLNPGYSSSSGATGDDSEEKYKVAYLNNVGNIFAMSGRYAVSNLYFQKALKAAGGLGESQRDVKQEEQGHETDNRWTSVNETQTEADIGREKQENKQKPKRRIIVDSDEYADVHKDNKNNTSNTNLRGDNDVKLSVEKYLMLYNLGASLLKGNKAEEAFRCFLRASNMPLLRKRCQLWIRLAECCVAIACKRSKQNRQYNCHHSQNYGLYDDCMGSTLQDAVFYLLTALNIVRELRERDQTTSPVCSFYGSLVADVGGRGGTTGIADDMVTSEKAIDKDYDGDGNGNGNYEEGVEEDDGYLSMRDSGHSQSAPTSTPSGDTVGVSVPVSYESMEIHILLKLSYVYLSMNDHSLALQHAKTVLSLPMSRIDESTRFLAETYSVEAYCALGQVEAAVAMLDPNSVPSETTLQDCHLDSGFVGDILPALSVADNTKLGILVNRTAVLILQGKLADAEALLRESRKLCPEHLPLKRNLVYVLLRRGRTCEALRVMSMGKS